MVIGIAAGASTILLLCLAAALLIVWRRRRQRYLPETTTRSTSRQSMVNSSTSIISPYLAISSLDKKPSNLIGEADNFGTQRQAFVVHALPVTKHPVASHYRSARHPRSNHPLDLRGPPALDPVPLSLPLTYGGMHPDDRMGTRDKSVTVSKDRVVRDDGVDRRLSTRTAPPKYTL
jgi:hypothetical protein